MDRTVEKTIIFSSKMHRRLTQLADRQGRRIDDLVREACETQFGFDRHPDRDAAVAELARLSLPVDGPAIMKRECAGSP